MCSVHLRWQHMFGIHCAHVCQRKMDSKSVGVLFVAPWQIVCDWWVIIFVSFVICFPASVVSQLWSLDSGLNIDGSSTAPAGKEYTRLLPERKGFEASWSQRRMLVKFHLEQQKHFWTLLISNTRANVSFFFFFSQQLISCKHAGIIITRLGKVWRPTDTDVTMSQSKWSNTVGLKIENNPRNTWHAIKRAKGWKLMVSPFSTLEKVKIIIYLFISYHHASADIGNSPSKFAQFQNQLAKPWSVSSTKL